jgi:hypothetical protein
MKNKFKIIFIAFLAILITGSSCRTGKGFCGCPNEQGMVGYK